MKLVKLDPPGSWCQYSAIDDQLAGVSPGIFLEVGCGTGNLSLRLLTQGWQGLGLDFSDAALEEAKTTLAPFIADGRYRLMAADIFDIDLAGEQFDVAISMMVMEHVENDVGFVRKIAQFVKPDGLLIIGVPGRRDRWGIEDETVGHFRRYERDDLSRTLGAAGLRDIRVWSVSVPVANVLFHLSNLLIRKSAELKKMEQSARQQTESSGNREIPGKTLFPAWCKLILNRFTLYPLFLLQRFFYATNFGLTLVARGRVASA